MNAPIIVTGSTVANAAFAEDALLQGPSNTHSVTATQRISFSDAGTGVGPAAPGAGEAHNLLLTAPGNAVSGAVLSAVIINEATGPADTQGYVEWSYSVPTAALQYLAAGQVLVQNYTLEIFDLDGQSVSQTITITITGTNDAPVISASAPSHTFGEDTTISASSSLAFTDVDVTDGHTVSTSLTTDGVTAGMPSGVDLLALLTATVTEVEPATAGSLNYSFASPSANFQYLAAGESVTLTYTLTLSDGHSGTATRNVVITINGANDTPAIAAVSHTIVDTSGDDTFANLTGTLAGTDADASDVLAYGISGAVASVEPGFDLQNVTGYGTIYLNSVSGAYKFVANDAAVEGLKTGDQVIFTTTVADGKGGTSSSTLTIDLTGANDAAVITGRVVGAVTEAGVVAGVAGDTSDLAHTDRDAADADDVWQAASLTGNYGSLTMTSAGVWSYALDDGNAAVNALNTGGTLTDSFTVLTEDGTQQVINVTINGTNDASISVGSGGTLSEAGGVLNGSNATPTLTGDINHTDVDNTNDLWTAATITAAHGTLVIGTDGAWTYTTDQANADVQGLSSAADSLVDTIMVSSSDGTLHAVTVTITGADDAAVIAGTITGAVTEAGGVANGTPGTPTATGLLTHTDVDADDADNTFTASNQSSAYGSLVLLADGNWTYALNNNATEVQALNGNSHDDVFTVTTSGGTTQTITITITGANDAAVITGTTSGTVTEAGGVANATAGTPSVSADLNATDVDNTADLWTAASVADAHGTFAITTAGVWTYTLDNTLAATQALASGAVVNKTFTVTTTDGTEQVVSVQVNGANDAPTGIASVAGIVAYTDAANSTTETNMAATGTGTQGVRGGSFTVSDVDSGAVLTVNDLDAFTSADLNAIRASAIFDWSNASGSLGTSTGLTSGAPTAGTIPTTGGLSTADRADILNAFDFTATTQPDGSLVINWSFDRDILTGSGFGNTVDSNATLPLPTTIGSLDLDFLAAGETLTVTFPVVVRDQFGASHTVNVPITFTGGNDAPTGTENWTVNLTEGSAVTSGDGSGAGTNNTLTGSLSSGVHTVVVVDSTVNANDVNGTFALAYSDNDRTDVVHTVARRRFLRPSGQPAARLLAISQPS